MHRIQFNTFLKLLSQPTHEKTRSYRRYEEPGGHDYYHPFKRAARKMTSGGKALEDVLRIADRVGPPWQREDNAAMTQELDLWLKKEKSNGFFTPPEGHFKSPNGVLSVILNPEVGRILKGRRQLIAVWTTKGVKLSQTAAGVGVHMMETKLKSRRDFKDCDCYVLDLLAPRLYGHGSVPNNPESYLAAEFAVAEMLLKQDDAA